MKSGFSSRRAFVTAAQLLVTLAALPAVAQEAGPAKPWRLETALGAPDWLSVSGTIRPRYETLAGEFVAGRTGDDHYANVTTQLKIEARAGDMVIGGELLDSRLISGPPDSSAPGEVDTLEPVQAYVAWSPGDFLASGASLDLMLGRFTLDVGSRRLVSRALYRSILTSFTGARAVWTHPAGAQVTVFHTAPVTRLPSDTASALDNQAKLNEDAENVRFQGLHLLAPVASGVLGEAYVLDLDERDSANLPSRNRQLVTAGLRLKRAPKVRMFDFDLELASQTGTSRSSTAAGNTTDLDHDALMAHAELGYMFEAPWSPRLSVHYDFASGDRTPADGSNDRFDPLFGDRSFELGPTSLWGAIARTNLSSPGVRIEVKPDKLTDSYLSIRQVDLDESADSFGNSGVRDASGLSGDAVGVQVEGRIRRWLVADSLRLEAGAAALLNGDFLDDAPNSTGNGDSYYGYTSMTFSF